MPLELRRIENLNRIRKFDLERQKLILEKMKLKAKGKRTNTWYKDFVNPRNYKFVETDRWNYLDPHKEDPRYDYEQNLPHFVLQDKTGRARFAIGFIEYKDYI